LGWKPDSVYQPNDWVVRQGYKEAGDPRSKAAEQLIKRLKAALEGYDFLAGYHGRITEKVERTGAVDTILGRHQWLGYDGGYKGLSGLIQGGAADIFKLGLIDSVDAVRPLGAYPLLFIHDEVLFETPIGTEKEVERVASDALVSAYPLRPHLAVESSVRVDLEEKRESSSGQKQFCPHGHDTFVVGRNTQGFCRACARENSAKWQREHPEKANKNSAKWQRAHPEQAREAHARWRREHPEAVSANNHRAYCKRMAKQGKQCTRRETK
jgi:hypothetical protein